MKIFANRIQNDRDTPITVRYIDINGHYATGTIPPHSIGIFTSKRKPKVVV